jgi:hypothetical protein
VLNEFRDQSLSAKFVRAKRSCEKAAIVFIALQFDAERARKR